MKRAVAAVLTALLFQDVAFPAPDGSLRPEDREEIKAVISAQIEAFRRDDAEKAFALASPGIQRTFGTAQHFLSMVKHSYQAVYRPASVVFLDLLETEDGVAQTVQISDQAGAVWLAVYPMQKQKDGSWRTHGCQLTRVKSLSI
jgi:hypothetical protein